MLVRNLLCYVPGTREDNERMGLPSAPYSVIGFISLPCLSRRAQGSDVLLGQDPQVFVL